MKKLPFLILSFLVTISSFSQQTITVADTITLAPIGIIPVNFSVFPNNKAAGLSVLEYSINGITYQSTTNTSATIQTISGVGNIIFKKDGTGIFTPLATYSGGNIEYTVTNSSGTSTHKLFVRRGIIQVPVQMNKVPVANADIKSTTAGTAIAGNLLSNDYVSDGDILTVQGYEINNTVYAVGTTNTIPGIGNITIYANGSYAFSNIAGYVGTVPVITYTISDGKGSVSTSTLSITVTGGVPIKKIMPLGNSITDGYNSPGAYRIKLSQLFATNNIEFDFVGSMKNGFGEMPDPDHEGHSGFVIDEITDLVNNDNILADYQPDIILLMIGANNINRNDDRAGSPARLDNLLSRIFVKSPNVKIIVSAICPIYSNPYGSTPLSAVVAYNTAIKSIVDSRIALGQKVAWCDNYTGMVKADFDDGIHPNETSGQPKIGQKFYNALIASGFLIDDPITSIKHTLARKGSWTIAPNPSNGIFTLQSQGMDNNIQSAEVYNMLGELIYSTASEIVNISDYPNGIYFVKIIDGENSYSLKIIKE